MEAGLPARGVKSRGLELPAATEPARGSCETSGKVDWLQAGVSPGGPALLTRERHTLIAASLPRSLYGAIEPRAAQSRKVLTVSFYFVLNKR